VLIPHKPEYHSFLFVLIKFNLEQITEGHQGSVINFITKGMIEEFSFKIPENIENYLHHFEAIYRRVDLNSAQISALTSLRDTLLPKLMSGQVRVKKKLDS
jgi:type I restriction enzyme S subunit